MYLTGYPGEVGWGGLPHYMLTGPRRGGDSETRGDCTNPIISCPFLIALLYDRSIKGLLKGLLLFFQNVSLFFLS